MGPWGPTSRRWQFFTQMGSYLACSTTPVISDTMSTSAGEHTCIFWSLFHSCTVSHGQCGPQCTHLSHHGYVDISISGHYHLAATVPSVPTFMCGKVHAVPKPGCPEVGPPARGSAHITIWQTAFPKHWINSPQIAGQEPLCLNANLNPGFSLQSCFSAPLPVAWEVASPG